MNDTVMIRGKTINGDEYQEEVRKDIEHYGIDWQDDLVSLDLSELKHCKQIKKISFQQMENLRRIDLSPLSYCPELEDISFSQMGLLEINISPLANCSKLKSLAFDYTSIKTIDLTPLQNCPEFESLNLAHGELNLLDLSPLAQCENFKTLSLWRNPVKKLNLSPLSGCKQLETVFLEDNKLSEIDLTPLTNSLNLKELVLENNYLTQVDLSPLINCKKLEYLNLTANMLEELDFSPLSNSESLEFIDLCHNKHLRKINLSSLNAPSFEKLEAFWCGIEEINLDGLANSKNFKYLLLKGNALKTIDLSPLKTTKTEIIELSFNAVDTIDLSLLDNCSELKELNLAGNNLTKINLEPMSECSKLERLTLDENQLSNVNLASLKNCSQLSYLSLENNLLEKIDLSPLSGLLFLNELRLAQNPLVGLEDCCEGEKRCPTIVSLPPLATGELDLEPLSNCDKLRTISYDFGCKILNEEKLPKLVSQIIYTHLSGSQKDGTPKYFLHNIMNRKLKAMKQGFKTIDLTPINQFQKLEVLNISSNLLEKINLKDAKSSTLRIFNAEFNQLTEIDLRVLRENYPNLEELKLAYNELSSLDLEALEGWEKLKTIDLTGNDKLSLDLKPLVSCPVLNKVIVSKDMTIRNSDHAKDKLEIYDKPIIQGVRKDGSKIVEEVVITKDGISAYIQILSEEAKLIDLNSAKTILPIVTSIRLSYLELQEIILAPLTKCVKLTDLSLDGNSFTKIDLAPLEHCFALESLSLSYCENLKEVDITPLLNLKNLQNFYINDETIINAKHSALQGDLPDALKDWYTDEIVWK
ncbi:MAG: leucine-rich repeat protein [Candidatus Heimdallarchaeaceae archaeon]